MVASAETQLPITIGNEEVIKLEQIATSAIVTLS